MLKEKVGGLSGWLVPPPLPLWPATMGTVLPTLCVSAALAACRSFLAATAFGWDKAHPRALERLPLEGIRALLRIFILSEVLGSWPRGIGVILVALLQKPGGGLRPIGLLTSLVRVWMRIRVPVAQAWQVANDRSFFYAGPSKGATVAAWRQSARAELAKGLAAPYVSLQLDLAKAFERVSWDRLVICAVRRGCNLYLLRLSLATYALQRAVGVMGVYSTQAVAQRGITVGSALATVELRVLLVTCCDEASRLGRGTALTVYVDDITNEAVGHKATQTCAVTVNAVVKGLTDMRMDF
jgi:hypothetical protein